MLFFVIKIQLTPTITNTSEIVSGIIFSNSYLLGTSTLIRNSEVSARWELTVMYCKSRDSPVHDVNQSLNDVSLLNIPMQVEFQIAIFQ